MNNMFQKEDVLPYMRGMWEDAFKSVCGLSASVFNKRHQSCPVCGGKDRFRWTDNLDEPGDGGAYCNSCGGDKGIGWMMKFTGESYSECVNILGNFLGKVPQEYVIKQNKKAHRDTGYNFGKTIEHDDCMRIMNKTVKMEVTRLSTFEGITDDYFDVGVREADGYQFHCVPCRIVYEDGPDSEYCNVLMIDEESRSRFAAGAMTLAAVSVIGSSDGAIYLVDNWIDGMHVNFSTGQEVWVCHSQPNIEIVAFRYKGDRELRVACKTDNTDALCSADERGLKVIIPNDGDFKRGMMKKLYKASDLL